MHLWNDYEGTTLAGQWKLGRLLRTEGRSALFATTQRDGRAAVLRLTESLNDQAVLHARFRAIQAAGDRYLVAVEGFGDAELDGAPLSYAVLEPTQESLADILAQRRLAAEEVQEVATSVAGGLLALHGQGLVHGLVEPESVLAANDHIKLRSDCARPAPSPEDAALEGAVTAQTDAFGLADVIYKSLTLERLHDASDALALPEPFATIVRNTARGTWGVAEIQAELFRYARAHATAVPAAAVPPAPATVVPPVAMPAPVALTPARPAPAAATATIAPAPVQSASVAAPAVRPARAASSPVTEAVMQEIPVVAAQPLSSRAAAFVKTPDEESAWQQPERVSSKKRQGILAGVGAALLLLLFFLVLHHGGKKATGTIQAGGTGRMTAGASIPAPALTAAPVPAKPSALIPNPTARIGTQEPAPQQKTAGLAPGTKVWRVVAYTYDRRDEAAAKAASLNQRFPGFDAQVWSRTGQRPFLLTLGGEMAKEQAFAMRARARHAKLARDVYAQNYER